MTKQIAYLRLAAVVMFFTQSPACNYSVTKMSTSSSLNSPFNIVSKASFDGSVRPLLLNHCASCHASSIHPLHSAASLDVAYSEIMTYSLVDLGNVANSRLYTRLAVEQHNCWGGDCTASAQAMLDALIAWKAANDAAPMPDDTSRFAGPQVDIPANVTATPVDLSLNVGATELKFTMLNHARGPVVFSARVEKYDSVSYRIFWPTITAPSGVKVILKDLRFKMNGKLLSEDAFSFLFREVSGQGATTPVVLDSMITLILLLDKGPGTDNLAPSFGLFTAQ